MSPPLFGVALFLTAPDTFKLLLLSLLASQPTLVANPWPHHPWVVAPRSRSEWRRTFLSLHLSCSRYRSAHRDFLRAHAFREGPNAFEFKGTNGFLLTFDMDSKDVANDKGSMGYWRAAFSSKRRSISAGSRACSSRVRNITEMGACWMNRSKTSPSRGR